MPKKQFIYTNQQTDLGIPSKRSVQMKKKKAQKSVLGRGTKGCLKIVARVFPSRWKAKE